MSFGIGILNPKKEVNVGTLWRHAYIMGADFLFTIGHKRYEMQRSDTERGAAKLPFHEFDSFHEFMRHTDGYVLVAVEQWGEPLHKFKHPANAIYLLGTEDFGIPQDILKLCKCKVEIKTQKRISLNVATAGSIVMYDRMSKE